MRRHRFAVWINLLVPGAGLIVLRREWLGLAVSLLFGVFSQIVIFGLWIVPADVPGWAVVGSVLAAVGTWVLAQWLAVTRVRFVTSPGLERELRALCTRAREAIEARDWPSAHRALVVASSLNDEDAELVQLRAELAADPTAKAMRHAQSTIDE